MRLGTKEFHFNLSKSLKQHDAEQAKCMRIDIVTLGCKERNYDLKKENSFDDYIFSSFDNDEVKKEEMIAKTILSLNERSTDNLNREEKIQVEEKISEGPVLTELPKHLKYVFLGEEISKPVTIAANLTVEKE